MTDAPLRIVLVDDEAPARNRLRDLIGDCAPMPLVVAGEADSGRAALQLLEDRPADVVLLDVRMPEMDGLELARHLQKLEHPPAIIFTTAYDSYAVQAFEVHAVDYLIKPIRVERLREALRRVMEARRMPMRPLPQLGEEPRRFLSVHARGKVELVPLGDVRFLRAELKYVTVRTHAQAYILDEPLTRLEQEFGERFVRVHRNCLIARAHIRGFERVTGADGEAHWETILDGVEERIPVSRRQQHIMREFGRS